MKQTYRTNWTVTMTFLKFFKFKQAKDETNLQDKLDLGRR